MYSVCLICHSFDECMGPKIYLFPFLFVLILIILLPFQIWQEELRDVLATACMLQLDNLVELCVSELTNYLDVSNCLGKTFETIDYLFIGFSLPIRRQMFYSCHCCDTIADMLNLCDQAK